MLDSLAVPAIVLTARWDVIAWNQLALKVIRDYSVPAAGAAQLAAHPARRGRGVSAGPGALRSDGAAASREVSRRLQPSARRSRVRGADRGVVRFLSDLQSPLGSCRGRRHARGSRDSSAGPGVTFEHSSYVPEGKPKQRLIIFTPCNDASAAKVREALAQTQVERPPLVSALAGIRTARSRFEPSRLGVLRLELAAPPRQRVLGVAVRLLQAR